MITYREGDQNGFKYKIYPVIFTLIEDKDEDLENRLLEEVEK